MLNMLKVLKMIKKLKAIKVVLRIKAINLSRDKTSIGSRGAMQVSEDLPGRASNKVKNDVKQIYF
jgi:hypothetical protein